MKNSRGAYRMMVMLTGLVEGVGDVFKKPEFKFSDYKSRRTFNYLEKAGYIRQANKQQNKFSLTDLGKINTLNELVKNRKPDGKIRAVIFDIPEKIRHKRKMLRNHLVGLGFKMEQQSVWTSKLPCEDLVKLIIRYHNLSKYTALIVGKVLQLKDRPDLVR